MDTADIEAYLHAHIPVSEAMGVRVIEASSERVVLEAPIAPNVNHRGTAFGGSVSALATLAGWTHVHLRLREDGHTGHTVIQRSTIEYDAPLTGSFRAVCEAVGAEAWDRFRRALDRRGKGRIHVDVGVEADGVQAARFHGAYVTMSVKDRGAASGR